MRIFALLGHPDPNSFNARILETYCEAAREAGNKVRVQNRAILSLLRFIYNPPAKIPKSKTVAWFSIKETLPSIHPFILVLY
jgi:hypothetical protein